MTSNPALLEAFRKQCKTFGADAAFLMWKDQAGVDRDDLLNIVKEFELLLALARRAGEVVSKRDLLSEVWQLAWGGSDRTVDVHLSWLRRKLGETAADPRYLLSVRGVGVRLVDPGASRDPGQPG